MKFIVFNLVFNWLVIHSVIGDSKVQMPDMINAIEETKLWAGGVIPYLFRDTDIVNGEMETVFHEADKNIAKQALDHIMENVPCLQFRYFQ